MEDVELTGEWYLRTTGMIVIERTVDGETKRLTYYQKDVLDELYEQYKKYKNKNTEYALNLRKYMQTTYTNSTGGHGEILVPTFNDTLTTVTYEYEKNNIKGKDKESEQEEMNYSVLNYDIVAAKYGTPVEFLMNLIEITGSSDFVNAFILEVTKTEKVIEDGEEVTKDKYEIVLGLYDKTRVTTVVEQESYTQKSTLKAEINASTSYVVRDTGPEGSPNFPGELISHTEESGTAAGKIKITAPAGLNKEGNVYTLYKNGNKVSSRLIESTNQYKAIWENEDAPIDKTYTATKSDAGKVTVTTTDIITENAYELAIKKVNCWWATIEMQTIESTNTQFVNVDEENVDEAIINQLLAGAGIEAATEEILKQSQGKEITKSPEEFTKVSSPNIFVYSSATETESGRDGFLNSIYNYTRKQSTLPIQYQSEVVLDPSMAAGIGALNAASVKQELESMGITESSYDYNSMLLEFTNATKKTSTIIQQKNVTYGVPKGEYNVEGVLALLRDAEGNVVEYADLYESKAGAGEMLVNGAEMLFQLLDSSENTEGLSDVMRYILYRYSGIDYGVTEFNYGVLGDIAFTGIGSVVTGGSIEEKVWFSLKAAGYNEYAIAGVMGNIWAESGFQTNNLENSYNTKLGYTDEEYTEAVNNGTYTVQKFISDHDINNCGAGYGLCQWTWGERKKGLYNYAKSKGVGIDDEDMQVEFLLGELSLSGGAGGYATCQINGKNNGYNYDSWYNAKSISEATRAFMCIFERPADISESAASARTQQAESYYNMFHGKTLSGGTEGASDTGSGITARFTSNITGRTFTVYNQGKVGLVGKCNRAAAACIASGYRGKGEDEKSPVSKVDAGGQDILSNATSTANFFNQYGLKAQIYNKDLYSTNNIRSMLSQGKYICLWINMQGTGKAGIGKSGTKYCNEGGIHWIAIIGYDYNNGNEKIYVADPGGFSGATGWHDLNEFDVLKQNIGYFTIISEK